MPPAAKILLLVSDAFGGQGGISRFNRDLAAALARLPGTERVEILPRQAPFALELLPARVVQRPTPFGKLGFAGAALRAAGTMDADLIICGHINLLPVATLCRQLAALTRRPPPKLALVIHGIDAWQPVRAPGLGAVSRVISVSRLTLDRFCAWSGVPPERTAVLPNQVDPGVFTPGPRSPALLRRYGLAGATVLMSLARLDAAERNKGFDELLAVLPSLLARWPDLRWLICGDGSDRPRLEADVQRRGLADRVIFTGFVAEAEKVEHYRLADAFILCGRQEGFGIVLLEALACGVPVIASRCDGSREAVLNGALGELADPDKPEELIAAVTRALSRPRPSMSRDRDALIEHFSPEAFACQLQKIVNTL